MNKVIGVVLLLALCAGCAHRLEYTGIDKYYTVYQDHSCKHLRVGIFCEGRDIESRMLVQQLQLALSSQAGYTVNVLNSYTGEDMPPLDVMVRLRAPKLRGEARVVNLPICFPGYILFAHAWHGYHYQVEMSAAYDLMSMPDKTLLDEAVVPLSLDVRYADIGRTTGNCVPYPIPIGPILNGIVQATWFDDDFIPTLRTEVYPAYAAQIAEKIMRVVNQQKEKKPISPPQKVEITAPEPKDTTSSNPLFLNAAQPPVEAQPKPEPKPVSPPPLDLGLTF